MKTRLAIAALLGASLIGLSAFALEEGPFNQAQSRAGRALYVANCAACHGPQLQGAGEAPSLAGSTFIAAWGNRSTEELYNLVKASMPYGNGNSLDPDTYRRIVAYVLSANGAKPGAKAFTGAETVKINSHRRRQGAGASGGGRSCARARSGGAALAGDVLSGDPLRPDRGRHLEKAMTPSPTRCWPIPRDGDWLMYRRNYQGWSHLAADTGQCRQCEAAAAAMVLGDEQRRRRSPGDAHRP